MPPQPSLPESRSRGFRHSSSYGHTVLCPNRKTYSSLRLLSLRFQDFLELLGRFELREDDFTSSSLLLFQHFAYRFCAALVSAYPYSSLFIFLCKGKTKGKTFITYKHSIAFLP